METKADNAQLDLELQELYIESSHWVSDVDFVEDEIRFLKKALHKYYACTESLQLHEAGKFMKMLDQQHAHIEEIKPHIAGFLKFIEPVITAPVKKVSIDLVEKYIGLQTEIKALSEYVHLVKSLVFAFIEEAIKAEKDTRIA